MKQIWKETGNGEGSMLVCGDGSTLRCKLVVVATGAAAGKFIQYEEQGVEVRAPSPASRYYHLKNITKADSSAVAVGTDLHSQYAEVRCFYLREVQSEWNSTYFLYVSKRVVIAKKIHHELVLKPCRWLLRLPTV